MIVIATHNGKFHADDVIACAMLKTLYPDASILRTRDQKQISKADFKVDVGGQYVPEDGYFDHHQTAPSLRYGDGSDMASAGLVWENKGKNIIKKEVKNKFPDLQLSDEELDIIFYYISSKLVRPVDLLDAGSKTVTHEDVLHFSDALDFYNPSNVPGVYKPTPQEVTAAFETLVDQHVQLIKMLVLRGLHFSRSRQIVKDELQKDQSELLVLDECLHWQTHIVELDTAKQKKLVIFPTNTGGTWMVQVVPISPDSYESLIRLPQEWAGLEFGELAQKTHVKESVFCHRRRFIMGAKTKKAAIEMAQAALKVVGYGSGGW